MSITEDFVYNTPLIEERQCNYFLKCLKVPKKKLILSSSEISSLRENYQGIAILCTNSESKRIYIKTMDKIISFIRENFDIKIHSTIINMMVWSFIDGTNSSGLTPEEWDSALKWIDSYINSIGEKTFLHVHNKNTEWEIFSSNHMDWVTPQRGVDEIIMYKRMMNPDRATGIIPRNYRCVTPSLKCENVYLINKKNLDLRNFSKEIFGMFEAVPEEYERIAGFYMVIPKEKLSKMYRFVAYLSSWIDEMRCEPDIIDCIHFVRGTAISLKTHLKNVHRISMLLSSAHIVFSKVAGIMTEGTNSCSFGTDFDLHNGFNTSTGVKIDVREATKLLRLEMEKSHKARHNDLVVFYLSTGIVAKDALCEMSILHHISKIFSNILFDQFEYMVMKMGNFGAKNAAWTAKPIEGGACIIPNLISPAEEHIHMRGIWKVSKKNI